MESEDSQLEKGVKIETEHKKTYNLIKRYFDAGKMITEKEFYRNIAIDHLRERNDYYNILLKAGL